MFLNSALRVSVALAFTALLTSCDSRPVCTASHIERMDHPQACPALLWGPDRLCNAPSTLLRICDEWEGMPTPSPRPPLAYSPGLGIDPQCLVLEPDGSVGSGPCL